MHVYLLGGNTYLAHARQEYIAYHHMTMALSSPYLGLVLVDSVGRSHYTALAIPEVVLSV